MKYLKFVGGAIVGCLVFIVAAIYFTQPVRADWSSCYAGVAAGGNVNTLSGDGVTIAADGFKGGLSVGCDKQIKQIVIGMRAEAASSTGDIEGNEIGRLTGSLVGRLGLAVSDTTLVYGLAGYAKQYNSELIPDTEGWLLGGGVSFKAGKHWSVGAEVTHFQGLKESVEGERFQPNELTGMFRVNRHFGDLLKLPALPKPFM